MAFSYRIRIWDLDNVPQAPLYVGEPIDTIDYWSTEGNGNCLEMSIKAKLIELTTQPDARFIGQLQSSDDGVSWRDHFKGYVARPGSARNNTRLSEIKLVGLK